MEKGLDGAVLDFVAVDLEEAAGRGAGVVPSLLSTLEPQAPIVCDLSVCCREMGVRKGKAKAKAEVREIWYGMYGRSPMYEGEGWMGG